MTDEHADEVRKHLKLYIGVFVALIVLTVATVAVSKLALGVALAVSVALIIATLKVSLVGAYFMHLAWEKRAIYALLLVAGAFLFSMMGLLIWSLDAHLPGTVKAPIEATEKHHPSPEGH
ncbi:MAG: cytochrome C oxidase subunit IV family protein [Acidobacteria bacterium]|nr:cytochrome C oxidase subunit IV family protein [Acidobacteriota bacterium]